MPRRDWRLRRQVGYYRDLGWVPEKIAYALGMTLTDVLEHFNNPVQDRRGPRAGGPPCSQCGAVHAHQKVKQTG